MQKHTAIYMKFFQYGIDDFICCEIAWSEGQTKRASDVHHVTGRGKGKDVIDNLMAVCRENHERCENKRKPYISKERQKEIHQQFINKFKP